MRKYRKFTPEFRANAVRQALASDRPTSEVARELKLRPDQLRHWISKAVHAGEVGPPTDETPAQELQRLRREVATLRQERDFLKKAAAFFANGSR